MSQGFYSTDPFGDPYCPPPVPTSTPVSNPFGEVRLEELEETVSNMAYQ